MEGGRPRRTTPAESRGRALTTRSSQPSATQRRPSGAGGRGGDVGQGVPTSRRRTARSQDGTRATGLSSATPGCAPESPREQPYVSSLQKRGLWAAGDGGHRDRVCEPRNRRGRAGPHLPATPASSWEQHAGPSAACGGRWECFPAREELRDRILFPPAAATRAPPVVGQIPGGQRRSGSEPPRRVTQGRRGVWAAVVNHCRGDGAGAGAGQAEKARALITPRIRQGLRSLAKGLTGLPHGTLNSGYLRAPCSSFPGDRVRWQVASGPQVPLTTPRPPDVAM